MPDIKVLDPHIDLDLLDLMLDLDPGALVWSPGQDPGSNDTIERRI